MYQVMELHRYLGAKVEVDVAVERLVKEASCATKGEEVPVRLPIYSVHNFFLKAISSTTSSSTQ